MAIYRNISMSFWTDNKVQDEFTPEDKYFYLYLLTNPQTNICGCYEISYKEIERETGYNRETINKLFFRFQHILNVIAFNEENKEVFLLNWHKYNLSTSDKTIAGARNVVAHVKTEEFRDELNYLLDCYKNKEPYTCRINGASMGHTYHIQASVSVSDIPKASNVSKYKNILDTSNEEYIGYINTNEDIKECIETWMTYKDEKKNKYQDTGIKSLLKKVWSNCLEYGNTAVISAIENSISNNYQGIVWDYLTRQKTGQIDRLKEIMDA